VERIQKTQQYESVVPIALVSDTVPRNDEAPAIKANLRTVLALLAGRPVSDDSRRAIPHGDQIKPATPNDLVLLSYSGHGYAGEQGVFYLLPADVGSEQGAEVTAALLARCLSSEELSQWLRDVDAGDMAMVVDACHSAASVEGQDFKPGPMGSRGLGQLAYDKGMRILAASQADSAALESEQLEQGLLSYALVNDGLEQGMADYKPEDRRITLSEWLSYGTERVPALYEAIFKGELKGAKGINASTKRKDLQQPVLFDFTRSRADVLLETKGLATGE